MAYAYAAFARSGLVGCLVGLGVLAPSVWAQKVNVHYDRETDFSHVRRYQWRTHPVFEKNPELTEIYATGIQLVLQAGNAELMKRGLQPDDSSPDIFVTFYLLTKDVQRLMRAVEAGGAAGNGWYGDPAWAASEDENYVTGMLVIDIVDARTSKLLWRAACGDKVKDMRKRDKNINSAVKKALANFPPK